MKKRIISITILIVSFLFLTSVNAEVKYTVSDVNSKYENYKAAVSELSTLSCDGQLTSQSLVDKCNELELTKSNSLAYLFNARAYDKSLISDDIEKALSDNSDKCSGIYTSNIKEIVNKLFVLFYIAGPILLLLFGTMDFTSAMVAPDEKARKAAYSKFARRTIALALLLVSPVLVKVLVNTFGGKKYNTDVYYCAFKERKITITYTPRLLANNQNGNLMGDSDAANRILEAAAAINRVSADGHWTYGCVHADNILKNYRNKAKNAHMCCADYVSAVLILAGIYTEDEVVHMEKFNSKNCSWGGRDSQASGVHAFLMKKGWIRITNIKDLKAGDILFVHPMFDYTPKCFRDAGVNRAGHVEIYAGDGKKFNAGNSKHIYTMGPHRYGFATTGEDRFIEAYRYPGNGGN